MEDAKNTCAQQLCALEEENVCLVQQLDEMRGQGAVALDCQVLSFKQNPLKLAMDAAKREKIQRIKAMERKIKKLEAQLNKANGNEKTDVNMEGNIKYFELENKYNILIRKLSNKNEEIEESKRQLLSSKKMYDRMKSLFGKKAGEYRERIYQMTGYNICLLGDAKHYRLKHVWMNEADDEIIIAIDKYGQLQLKDTDFMRTSVNKGALIKSKKTGSLPVFLSELTLSLYKD